MTVTLPAPTCERPLRVRPAIDVEPPALDGGEVARLYARTHHRGVLLARPAGYEQARLAVDFRGADNDPRFGPQATPAHDLPAVDGWVARLLPALLECLGGARSPRQLAYWLDLDTHQQVAGRFAARQRRGGTRLQPARIRRVRTCQPQDGVAEVSAVVHLDGRPRAMALRLNGADGRWVVTELLIA